jgi:hypothetical protein
MTRCNSLSLRPDMFQFGLTLAREAIAHACDWFMQKGDNFGLSAETSVRQAGFGLILLSSSLEPW